MRACLLFLLIAVLPNWARAEIAQLEMRPKINASAEYLSGQRDKPAVLLLHGFLQTREFPTVATLARGLNEAGYPVLTPTLSLGIPNRRQSLACEAIHRHGMEDDLNEISRWVDWLKSRGHRSVVLVGHSFGSLQLLAYLGAQPDPVIKGYVGASLIEVQIGSPQRSGLMSRLQDRISKGQHALVTQQLSLCKKYTSTPRGLLSYLRWDQSQTLAALQHAPDNTLLIMGDADTMLARNWLKALKLARTPITIVKGANHFMDGAHEFDLLEKTLEFLGGAELSASR